METVDEGEEIDLMKTVKSLLYSGRSGTVAGGWTGRMPAQ
jgi:hypothetical protein